MYRVQHSTGAFLSTLSGCLQEFDRNVGGARRADIFPQFSPFKPPLPQPTPGDPEEDEEDDEKEGDEEDPDENPEEKPEE